MIVGISSQRVHDVRALDIHQLLGLGALFGIDASNRWMVDHLASQHPSSSWSSLKNHATGSKKFWKRPESLVGQAKERLISHAEI